MYLTGHGRKAEWEAPGKRMTPYGSTLVAIYGSSVL